MCKHGDNQSYNLNLFVQVIYPHTAEQMKALGKTDEDLVEHLDRVQLAYLLNRDGGWDAIADWLDVLSGGEKQRIAVSCEHTKSKIR